MDFTRMELQEVGYGIKFHNPIPISLEETNRLFNILREKDPKKIENVGHSESDDVKLIFGKRDSRLIILNPNSIDYRERKPITNAHIPKSYARTILDFYLDEKKVDWESIKVIGKYFTYKLHLSEDSADFLTKNKLKLFNDEDISTCYLKTTLLREDKNVHLHFEGKSKKLSEIDEDDEVDREEAETLTIRVDINNKDQRTTLPQDFFENVINYADDFTKNQLIELLNTQFSD